MATLIAIYTSDGCVGRCDAKCYNAWGPECHCVCQGGNHGAGKQDAIASTRELAGSWLDRAEAAGQLISVFESATMPATDPQDGGHDLSRPPCCAPAAPAAPKRTTASRCQPANATTAPEGEPR